MSRSDDLKKSQMGKRAEPIREFLKQLLREKLKTRADKQKLAEFLGTSESYIKQMIYHGEGGLDAWVNALIFCYDIDAQNLPEFFQLYKNVLRKKSPITDSDKLWFGLDDVIDEQDKLYWAHIIRVANDIEQDFVKAKVKGHPRTVRKKR